MSFRFSQTLWAGTRLTTALRFYSTPTFANQGERQIYEKLTQALEPTTLTVADISGGCGSMYRISVCSPKFQGLNLVRQHRKVNEILKDEISGMHGLQLETSAPKPTKA
ncbi:hypothetical protein H4R33_006528 [Dimargaris cristalligena]|uniref:Bola protein n=1 Tax=Dimargaris cristalligena TaxID=215637 RepID=A0A4P9ZN24_9FUNG|nr:hypothetical protein H4R33_006528 [Dimargaris cristalligena]RKP33710.1 bola protein [Dimargaris cristalligena]|eukprot:RKP33710.1 bola protein [Dimargaris cristalligena]